MATVTRWDPLRDLMNLQERIDRMFDDLLSRPRLGGLELTTSAWVPPVDIYETEDELVLELDVPGVDQKEVDVHLENNTLTIRGQRKFDESRRDSYHRIERPYGQFVRSFTLPNFVDQDKISATYRNGVLRISMPKREETKPKQIQITVK